METEGAASGAVLWAPEERDSFAVGEILPLARHQIHLGLVRGHLPAPQREQAGVKRCPVREGRHGPNNRGGLTRGRRFPDLGGLVESANTKRQPHWEMRGASRAVLNFRSDSGALKEVMHQEIVNGPTDGRTNVACVFERGESQSHVAFLGTMPLNHSRRRVEIRSNDKGDPI